MAGERMFGRLIDNLRLRTGGGDQVWLPVTRLDVIDAFREVLGRLPESELVIQGHMGLPDPAALRNVLRRSPEFALRASTTSTQGTAAAAAMGSGSHGEVNRRRSALRIAIYGNCQAVPVARLMQAMTGGEMPSVEATTGALLARMRQGDWSVFDAVRKSDLVFVQGIDDLVQAIALALPEHAHKVRRLPMVNFSGFHPDIVYVTESAAGRHLRGPLSEYHSAIALAGWTSGLSVGETLRLFRDDVFAELGYFAQWQLACSALAADFAWAGLSLQDHLARWTSEGCWMHSVNHPAQRVLADVAEQVLRMEGIAASPRAAQFVTDPLIVDAIWPVYPEIAQSIGVPGGYEFKCPDGLGGASCPVLSINLEEMVASSHAVYNSKRRSALHCDRLLGVAYSDMRRFVRLSGTEPESDASPAAVSENAASAGGAATSRSPYLDLPDHQFWRRAVSLCPMGELDPVVTTGFSLRHADRVATAGSCFAQHISNTLRAQGFQFLVTETGAGLPEQEAADRQFGLFSARYGNVYTARQLLQLFDRACGNFQPLDNAWQRPDGRWVDPFRPQVEPAGFADPAGVASARVVHLAAVRRMFEELDVLVFTLGLTESWHNLQDGAVYPLAPGVVAGQLDRDTHAFVNFGVDEVCADLHAFVTRLRERNPHARLILTVSPVPLIATYEPRHVLVSNTASKAVLRVAADRSARLIPGVDYFPSFEVITGAGQRYFEDDLRSVTAAGVGHVMRVFLKHYAPSLIAKGDNKAFAQEVAQLAEIFCDEQELDKQ